MGCYYLSNNLANYAFGCRSPKSKGVGLWDGAFVYAQNSIQNILSIFEDGMDYVSNPNDQFEKVYNDAINIFKEKIAEGWVPMTQEDIKKTSGIIIDVLF